MIDPNSEHVISLSEAAEHLPRRRAGKRPHVSCVYRWTTSGCRGVVLESIQVGGTRCTSREAMARFFRRLTQDGPADIPVNRSVAQRQRAADRAVRELDRAGV
ncbi:MAG: DUF1580 domain-containing protein [Planctomycetaceae bacterium]|nr:DUF1580 domain-containing protein [Planctomycetaceae bacterium]